MLHQVHETDKVAYATILRSLFSNPEMLNYDGTINQEYFMPSKNIFNKETLETVLWSYHEDKVLIEAIEKFGIGNWFSMIIEYLPNWFFFFLIYFWRDSLELKKRTCVLLGLLNVDDLEKYKDWKGNEKDFETEKLKNEKENEKSSKKSTITFEREIFDFIEPEPKKVEKIINKKSRKKKKNSFKKVKDEDDYEDDYEDYDVDNNDTSFKGRISKEESDFYVERRKSKRIAKNEIEGFSRKIENDYEDDFEEDFE